MSEEKKEQNIDRYARDLATIKSLLMEVEKRPFLEFWAFFTWAGLILTGTLLHYWLRISYKLPEPDIFIYVWLPLCIVASFLETVAWLRRMQKESMPLMNSTAIKLFIGMGAMMIAMGLFLVISAKATGYCYVPHIVLAMYGIFILYFGQISHGFYFGAGYFLILFAVLLYLLPVPKDLAYLAGGTVLALTFAVTGEVTRRVEKGKK